MDDDWGYPLCYLGNPRFWFLLLISSYVLGMLTLFINTWGFLGNHKNYLVGGESEHVGQHTECFCTIRFGKMKNEIYSISKRTYISTIHCIYENHYQLEKNNYQLYIHYIYPMDILVNAQSLSFK